MATSENRLTLNAISAQPGDDHWAAQKALSFSDEDIHAIIHSAATPAPRSGRRSLIERRDKIGRALLNDVLPLDDFAVRDGKLVFDDQAARYGFREPQVYSVQWFEFDNRAGARNLTPPAKSLGVPADPSEYLAAVAVCLRDQSAVGIDPT